MEISSNFDGGKVGVVSAERSDDIRLKILPDNEANFAQAFKVGEGAKVAIPRKTQAVR